MGNRIGFVFRAYLYVSGKFKAGNNYLPLRLKSPALIKPNGNTALSGRFTPTSFNTPYRKIKCLYNILIIKQINIDNTELFTARRRKRTQYYDKLTALEASR